MRSTRYQPTEISNYSNPETGGTALTLETFLLDKQRSASGTSSRDRSINGHWALKLRLTRPLRRIWFLEILVNIFINRWASKKTFWSCYSVVAVVGIKWTLLNCPNGKYRSSKIKVAVKVIVLVHCIYYHYCIVIASHSELCSCNDYVMEKNLIYLTQNVWSSFDIWQSN